MLRAVLVDSNVYINLLKKGLDPAVELVRRDVELDLVTCGMVMTEVLRGISARMVMEEMRKYMSVMHYVPTSKRVWEKAAQLAWHMDRIGRTIPEQVLLIATCAMEIGATVMTHDEHYLWIPELHVINSVRDLE